MEGNYLIKSKVYCLKHYIKLFSVSIATTAFSQIIVPTREIQLSLKGLTDVPDNIPADATHVHLDLNFISEIKMNVFSHLNICVLLNLTNNEIHTIENGGFNGLNRTRYLILNDNKLTSLTHGMLKGLEAIRTLKICCNKISTIEDELFSEMSMLGILDLSQNQLTSIRRKTFAGIKIRLSVYLQQNKIKTLAPEMFSDIPRPFALGLGKPIEMYYDTRDGYLTCDSRLCWLKKEDKARKIKWGVIGEHKPRCENNVDWETWQCTTKG